MKEFVATLTSKGQITIPAEVRKHLNLTRNSKVSFILDDDGTVRLEPVTYENVDAIVGIAGALDRELSWEETLAIAYEDRKITE